LNLHTVIGDYTGRGIDFDKLFDDKAYREEFLAALRKYYDSLQAINEEMPSDTSVFNRFNGMDYYNYFSKKPSFRSKYKSKAEEVFFIELNK